MTGATLTDPLTAGLENAIWTCVGQGGGSCPSAGNGPLDIQVDLPDGGQVTVTLTAQVETGFSQDITNTATITSPASVEELEPGDNSASDTRRGDRIFRDRFEVN